MREKDFFHEEKIMQSFYLYKGFLWIWKCVTFCVGFSIETGRWLEEDSGEVNICLFIAWRIQVSSLTHFNSSNAKSIRIFPVLFHVTALENIYMNCGPFLRPIFNPNYTYTYICIIPSSIELLSIQVN